MNEDCPGCVTARGSGGKHRAERQAGLIPPPRSNGAPDGVRPPDESRLPPPGSFRSGLYRLLRALFINQGPNPKNTGVPPEAPVERESAKQPASGAAPSAPEPDGTRQTGTRAGRGAHRGRRSGASITKSMHWLAQAVLAGQVLPRRTANPATLPVLPQTRPGRHWRPVVPSLPELPGGIERIRRWSAAALSRARGALSQGEEPPVPRSLEVALVTALTVAAVFLRTWNLSGAPVGVHGDETRVGDGGPALHKRREHRHLDRGYAGPPRRIRALDGAHLPAGRSGRGRHAPRVRHPGARPSFRSATCLCVASIPSEWQLCRPPWLPFPSGS